MKKNYLKLKIKLIAILFLVLLVGCTVLTYQKAKDIQREYIQQVNKSMYFDATLRMNCADENDDFIQQVYEAYYNVSRDPDIGFYSMLKDKEGNTIAEDQSFIIVQKTDNEKDRRIGLLGDKFMDLKEEAILGLGIFSVSEMEIVGVCDDIFLYIEEINWKNLIQDESYSYEPGTMGDSLSGTMPFEEWSGRPYYNDDNFPINKYMIYVNIPFHIYGDYDKMLKLNEEAKEICEKIYLDDVNGVESVDYQCEESLFTTYIGNQGYLSDEYKIPYVFVFHPVSLAMEELVAIYFVMGMFAIVVMISICVLVNRIYCQQLAYENNRRELTRGIAHELKTPLAITKGYLENWEYLGETERQESSKTMIAEIAHMDRMVTDLLELSHLEAKAKKLNLESVDLQALARSVVGRMKPIIEEKQLIVSGNIDDEQTDGEKYLVEADLEMMRVVLVNLVSNAVKYADKEINISLSENGKRVGFVIANDGQTVAVENIGKVWDEFYRDETVDAKRIGGSGLGLAITKNVLILHGAKYGCKSEPGRTSFWFEIKR